MPSPNGLVNGWNSGGAVHDITGSRPAERFDGAVIWDLDGVLVDSEPLLLEAERIAFAEHGVALTPERKLPFVGLGGTEVLAALADAFGLDVDLGELAARKVAAYLELAPTLVGFAATTDLVRGLAAAGVPMAVASGSSRAAIDAALLAIGLDTHIQVRVSVDEVTAGKPAPDVFLAAAERLGVDPQNCVVVEDAVPGLLAAKAAGMRCVAIPSVTDPLDDRFEQADLLIRAGMTAAGPDELLAWILGGPSSSRAAGTAPDTPDEARITERVDALLSQMTVAEKAGQLTQYFYLNLPPAAEIEELLHTDFSAQPLMVEAALRAGWVGALLFVRDPAEANRLQRLAVEGNRHGIPALFGFDVIHGLRTILPVPIALAASWDPETIAAGQAVAARESRAVGIHWTFASMVDIARDPRWGRLVESAGEDPYLGAEVAVAQVRGFQGDDLRADDRIIAGPKHFAGYGAALGGRDYDEVNLSDSEMWNVYLPPFKAVVDAGAGNIMTAYMDLNGIPATGNRWLLAEVLRRTWGFDGFVVSDAQAVHNLLTHGFAADLTEAAARAVTAGVDLEMAITDPAYAQLPAATEAGLVDEAALDACVRRVLAKIRLGLFENPYVDEDRARQVLADPVHRAVARTAAQRSAVLLRNEGELLPLTAPGSVAVIGPLADSRRDTLGPWVFDYDSSETVTVLDGIRRRAGTATTVGYAPGVRPVQRTFQSMFDMWGDNTPADPVDFDDAAEFDRAVALARDADVAVVVLGEWQNMIGEAASRSSLELPGGQPALLEAMVATGTPVVLLVMNGRPLDLRWAAEHVPAILDIWYPGTQGGAAVADLLFGDVAPGGKLPFSWPRTVGQVPIVYSHTISHEPDKQGQRYWDEASTPLFPFGHGLSYGRFEYTDLKLDRDRIRPGETVTVSVTVTNVGPRDGDEVAQLYIHQRHGSASRPVRELKGFRRLSLSAGESRTVRFEVGPDELRYWNAATKDWVLDATTIDVYVGGDA
ncbi:MAG TPA: beta-glucosidase BglX, partial [Nakamurella sp.]